MTGVIRRYLWVNKSLRHNLACLKYKTFHINKFILALLTFRLIRQSLWRRGVVIAVVINIAQLHLTKSTLRLYPARGMSEIRDGEDLWQWSRLEIKLNAFRRSTIPQKKFILIIYWMKSLYFISKLLSIGTQENHMLKD